MSLKFGRDSALDQYIKTQIECLQKLQIKYKEVKTKKEEEGDESGVRWCTIIPNTETIYNTVKLRSISRELDEKIDYMENLCGSIELRELNKS